MAIVSGNSLYPAFVVIDYSSTAGPHKMVLPTSEWTPPDGTYPYGSYQSWDSNTIDADTMVGNLVAVLADLMLAAFVFSSYSIFTLDSPGAAPLFGTTNELAVNGQSISTSWWKATQTTFTFLDGEGKPGKLVLLDSISENDWNAVVSYGDLSADEKAIVDEFTSVGAAWATRNGERPQTFRKRLRTLNDKLRRAYYMD